MRRKYYIDGDDSSDGSYDENTAKVVLTIAGIGEAPLDMKSRINSSKFTSKTDSGSPVTIFTTKDFKDIQRTDVLFARLLPHSEKNEDFNQQPMKIAIFDHVQLKVAEQELKTA